MCGKIISAALKYATTFGVVLFFYIITINM